MDKEELIQSGREIAQEDEINTNLIRRPFERKYLDEENPRKGYKGKIFTIRLNEGERKDLEHAKKFLNQEKDSTACKQLMMIGYINVLQDKKIRAILDHVINNKRRNKRLGIVEFEQM